MLLSVEGQIPPIEVEKRPVLSAKIAIEVRTYLPNNSKAIDTELRVLQAKVAIEVRTYLPNNSKAVNTELRVQKAKIAIGVRTYFCRTTQRL